MPPLPDAIRPVFAPFALLLSPRVWCQALVLLRGAMLAPGARTVTSAVRGMGLSAERRVTNDPRVLNRAVCSARQGSRIVLGLWLTLLVPPGATSGLGADDTVERRSGRKIRAKGGYRAAVRSSHTHVSRGVGLNWVSMRR
jgi:DDE superfamily endonuclease